MITSRSRNSQDRQARGPLIHHAETFPDRGAFFVCQRDKLFRLRVCCRIVSGEHLNQRCYGECKHQSGGLINIARFAKRAVRTRDKGPRTAQMDQTRSFGDVRVMSAFFVSRLNVDVAALRFRVTNRHRFPTRRELSATFACASGMAIFSTSGCTDPRNLSSPHSIIVSGRGQRHAPRRTGNNRISFRRKI